MAETSKQKVNTDKKLREFRQFILQNGWDVDIKDMSKDDMNSQLCLYFEHLISDGQSRYLIIKMHDTLMAYLKEHSILVKEDEQFAQFRQVYKDLLATPHHSMLYSVTKEKTGEDVLHKFRNGSVMRQRWNLIRQGKITSLDYKVSRKKPRVLKSGVECPHCGWLGKTIRAVYSHYNTCQLIPKGKAIFCKMCKHKSADLTSHTEHLKSHPTCKICRQSLLTLDDFLKHTEDKHSLCPVCCTYLESSQPFQFSQHSSSHENINCFWCGEFFTHISYLIRHFKSHDNRKCPVCSASLENQYGYILHLQEHFGLIDATECAQRDGRGTWQEGGRSDGRAAERLKTKAEIKIEISSDEEGVGEYQPPVKCRAKAGTSTGMGIHANRGVGPPAGRPQDRAGSVRTAAVKQRPTMAATPRNTVEVYKGQGLRAKDEYPCKLCGVKFKEYSKFLVHQQKHTTCSICRLNLPGVVPLLTHLDDKHPPCGTCGMRFENRSHVTMRAHWEGHPIPKCMICGNSFQNHYKLMTHFVSGHDEKQCHLCDGLFTCMEQLVTHLNTTHFNLTSAKMVTAPLPQFHGTCEFCGWFSMKKSEQDLLNHYNACRKSVMCSVCNEAFESVRLYQRHARAHAYCAKCSHITKNVELLLEHMEEVHPMCAVCGHICSDAMGLNRHLEAHREKECFWCLKVFPDYRLLIEHMASHDQQKCYFCKEMMLSERDLIAHCRERHSAEVNRSNQNLASFLQVARTSDRQPNAAAVKYTGTGLQTRTKPPGTAGGEPAGKRRVPAGRPFQVTDTKSETFAICGICKHIAADHRSLRAHMKAHAICKYCNKVQDDNKDLNSHMEKQHPLCMVCGTTIEEHTQIKAHYATHRTYTCYWCGATEESLPGLQEHFSRHRESRCRVCEVITENKLALAKHLLEDHEPDVEKEEAVVRPMPTPPDAVVLPGEEVGLDSEIVEEIEKVVSDFRDSKDAQETLIQQSKAQGTNWCTVCLRVCPNDEEFRKHFQTHAKCQYCDRMFEDDRTLTTHRNRYHLSRTQVPCRPDRRGPPKARPKPVVHPNECQQCSARFETEIDLVSHIQYQHTICLLCGHVLRTEEFTVSHYVYHQRHNNKMSCFQCSQYFRNMVELVRHYDEVHSMCKLCGHRASLAFPLTDHILSRHGSEEEYEEQKSYLEPLLVCTECGEASYGVEQLAIHIGNGHSDDGPKTRDFPPRWQLKTGTLDKWQREAVNFNPLGSFHYWKCQWWDRKGMKKICPYQCRVSLERLTIDNFEHVCYKCMTEFPTKYSLLVHRQRQHHKKVKGDILHGGSRNALDGPVLTNLQTQIKEEPQDAEVLQLPEPMEEQSPSRAGSGQSAFQVEYQAIKEEEEDEFLNADQEEEPEEILEEEPEEEPEDEAGEEEEEPEEEEEENRKKPTISSVWHVDEKEEELEDEAREEEEEPEEENSG